MNEIIVSICCQTYNHIDYIEEAIESFLMQKTSFNFEILIRDDASTDGTKEIVQKYALKFPELINLLTYEENQYKKGISPFSDNAKRAKGKYIAFCEGDDYWTDPLKLQKQVDFLENNPFYTFCFTRFYTLNQSTQEKKIDENSRYFQGEQDIEFDFRRFKLWHIGTQTVLFKNLPHLPNSILEYKIPSDIHIYVELLKSGKGKCLKDFCAVYRITGTGLYTSENANSRLLRGVNMYEEIYLKNKKNKFLKQKYLMFSRKHLLFLIERKNYKSFFYNLFKTTKTTLSLKFFLRSLLSIK